MTNSRTIEGLYSTKYENMSVAAARTWTSSIPCFMAKHLLFSSLRHLIKAHRMFKLTSMTSRAWRMPMPDNVLKKASLF